MKQTLRSDAVAPTKGPYVQGIKVTGGALVYTSGVVARDRSGAIVGHNDIRLQTHQALANIRHIIEAGGGTLSDIVKMTVFLRRLEDYAGMHEVRRALLADIPFASSTVQALLHDPDALIEIEAVAAVPAPSPVSAA